MNRRTFLTAVALPLSAAFLFAACGDDASGDRPDVDGTDVPTTTAPPPTTVPPTTAAPGITHPTGADEVVLHLSADGGFVPADYLFVRLPRVIITGDGSVYTTGAQIEIFPQPLLPPVLVGKISEARLQELLKAASDADLFREITYAPRNDVTDLPDTVLVINVNGTTYTHSAYALGFDGEKDADRKAYAAYVDVLDAVAAEDLGSKPFEPVKYAIRATPADEAGTPTDVTPNEIDWPAGTGVQLSAASECAVVDAAVVAKAFAEATQITRFIEGGQKFVLAVRPLVPGDSGC